MGSCHSTFGETKPNSDNEDSSRWKASVESVELNSYMVHHGGQELSLLTFNLKLNQLLMLLNNPMLFPSIAYAEMFN